MKKFILIIIFILSGGLLTAWYLYTKPVADLNNETADFNISAIELFNAFEKDEFGANEKYLGKIIQVNGVVKELKSDEEGFSVIMETGDMLFGVNCGLGAGQEKEYNNFKSGDSIIIKGECTGIAMDVVLVRSVIIN